MALKPNALRRVLADGKWHAFSELYEVLHTTWNDTEAHRIFVQSRITGRPAHIQEGMLARPLAARLCDGRITGLRRALAKQVLTGHVARRGRSAATYEYRLTNKAPSVRNPRQGLRMHELLRWLCTRKRFPVTSTDVVRALGSRVSEAVALARGRRKRLNPDEVTPADAIRVGRRIMVMKMIANLRSTHREDWIVEGRRGLWTIRPRHPHRLLAKPMELPDDEA